MRNDGRKAIIYNAQLVIKPVNILLLVLGFLIFYSCAEKKPSIEERLDSTDVAVVKSALTDAWRTGETGFAAEITLLLENLFLKEAAAFSLYMMDLKTADMTALNRLGTADDKSGILFYIYLRMKDGKFSRDYVSGGKGLKGETLFIYYMIKAVNDSSEIKNAVEADKMTGNRTIPDARKEFFILIGKKKYRPALGYLEDCLNTAKKSEVPFIKWAISRIKTSSSAGYDVKDRVITENPLWKKDPDNPVMPTVPGSFKSVHTANPDTLVHNGMVYFYYRGGDGNDRIAVATIPYERFDGKTFYDYASNPVISTGKEGEFDMLAVLDPAAVYFRDKVFLYYSGLSAHRAGPDAVGLAVSEDFYNFKKVRNNPVLTGRAPEIVVKDGRVYMYFVDINEINGYSVFLATSDDGYNFTKFGKMPVFKYGMENNAWDGKTVTTPRILEKDGVYYMIYCGDNRYRDYPPYFGIAFSYDLVNWIRSSKNPVFSRGEKGKWDDGGIWYGEVMEYKGKYYMWYEGWGGGESHEKEYGPGGHSQIGLAVSKVDITDML